MEELSPKKTNKINSPSKPLNKNLRKRKISINHENDAKNELILTNKLLDDPIELKSKLKECNSISIPLTFNNFNYLKYDIESWSSYIGSYHPKNILNDLPDDLTSRWSLDYKSQNEFLLLKLERTSIVFFAIFGKSKKEFEEGPKTILKDFKIFAGLDKDNMCEILHSGLSNDNDYETIPVKYEFDNCLMPSK